MFHQSFDPFGRRFDAPLRRVEGSPRHKRKSLAKRLEEQERELMQLSFEELPFNLHEQRMNRERLAHQRNESWPHFLDQNDAVAVDEHLLRRRERRGGVLRPAQVTDVDDGIRQEARHAHAVAGQGAGGRGRPRRLARAGLRGAGALAVRWGGRARVENAQ